MSSLSRVRLRYTGLTIFSSRVFSIATGLVFTVIVVRKLSVAEYGLWQFIASFASYFTLLSTIFPYWTSRFVARGFKASKTGLLANLLVSSVCFALFMVTAPKVALTVNADVIYFVVFAFQIPLMYAISSLEAIGGGAKPHVVGYGYAAFEVFKVVFCLLTVMALGLGLLGAMAAVVLAYLMQSMVLLLLLRDFIVGPFDLKLLKRWLAVSWLPLYGQAAGALSSLVPLVLTWITASTTPVALLAAPAVISNLVGYAGFLSSGLYPRLLRGGDRGDVEAVLKIVLMIAVPATVGLLILARPLLCVLRPEYAVASNIVRVLALGNLIGASATVPGAILGGMEKVDLDEKASFREYVKSKLFLLPTLALLTGAVNVALAVLLAYHATLTGIDYVTLIFNYVLAYLLLVTIPTNVYVWLLAWRTLPFNLPVKSIVKYLTSSTVMAVALISLHPDEMYAEKIDQALRLILPTVGYGALTYFITLLIIDKEARHLARILLKSLIRASLRQ